MQRKAKKGAKRRVGDEANGAQVKEQGEHASPKGGALKKTEGQELEEREVGAGVGAKGTRRKESVNSASTTEGGAKSEGGTRATERMLKSLEEDLTCSICLELLIRPVTVCCFPPL